MDVGLYGPASISWKINRERVVLLAGPRALLMQLAHPRVAAGVEEHSDFRRRPFRRLVRTVALTHAGVFGTTTTALGSTRAINSVHARIRGAGYQATDPDLLLWVMATLVESAVVGYERFVGSLAAGEADAFYAETLAHSELLGLPPSAAPATLAELRTYIAEMIRSGEVRVDERSRALAHDTLYPPLLTWIPRPAFDLGTLITAGLLPPALRVEFGLPWSHRHQAIFDVLSRIIRGAVPLMPRLVREVPHARAAERRLRAADR